MKVVGIILLIVGVIFAGLGVMYYVQYRDLRTAALSNFEKSQQLREQAYAKEGTPEGDKLVLEYRKARDIYRYSMESAQQPKGYALMNGIISALSLCLGITLLFLARRKIHARAGEVLQQT